MLNSIQTLRALAAWMVVFHHYMQLVHNFQLTDPVSVAMQWYGAIGVDLFFVISGFVIYLSATGKNISPGAFIRHRLARVAPAYWIFSVITAVTLMVLPGLVPLTVFEPTFLLKSLMFIPAQNPSGIGLYPLMTVGWTLNYEMAFYVVFLASLLSPEKFRVPTIILGIFLLYKALPHLDGSLAFYHNPIVFEFAFGIVIAYAYQKKLVQRIPLIPALIMAAVSLGMIIHYGPATHSPWKSGLPCAAILVAAISQERFFSRVEIVNKLGDWSYSTYLCHVLVISYMIKIQQMLNLGPVTTLAIIIGLVTVISGLSYNLIEKPISRWVKAYDKRPSVVPTGAPN
ncbi:acyltransferase [Pseudomonas sp. B28(2017)]|uniref:acyltransferase family protein n=1 Tax=Pseudomonas sp. B28(2017) TaxID=1981730 RepID=UPI000A1DD187|nr:acyltransferase [Pseudomonas sp. B28(2017)]